MHSAEWKKHTNNISKKWNIIGLFQPHPNTSQGPLKWTLGTTDPLRLVIKIFPFHKGRKDCVTYMHIGKEILHDINVGGEFAWHTEIRKDCMTSPKSVWIGGNLYIWRSDCNKISRNISLTAWHKEHKVVWWCKTYSELWGKGNSSMLLKLYKKIISPNSLCWRFPYSLVTCLVDILSFFKGEMTWQAHRVV